MGLGPVRDRLLQANEISPPCRLGQVRGPRRLIKGGSVIIEQQGYS